MVGLVEVVWERGNGSGCGIGGGIYFVVVYILPDTCLYKKAVISFVGKTTEFL